MTEIPKSSSKEKNSEFFTTDFSHPYKRRALNYIIFSILSAIVILIVRGQNPLIFGYFDKFILALSGIIYTLNGMCLIFIFFKPIYKYKTVKSSIPYHILEKDFKRKFDQLSQNFPIYIPPKKKYFLEIIFIILWIIVAILGHLWNINKGEENEGAYAISFGVFLIIQMMISYVLICQAIDNSTKRKIQKANILQQGFFKYYKGLSLRFNVDTGKFRDPGFGIKFLSSPKTDEQSSVCKFINDGRNLLYFAANRDIVLFIFVPLLMVLITPFVFNLQDPQELFSMIVLEIIFLFWFIIVMYKFNNREKLKYQICMALGIYLPNFNDMQSGSEYLR